MPENHAPAVLRGSFVKADDEARLVFGWVSVVTDEGGSPLVDKQGDVLDVASLEKAVYAYVEESRTAGEMHERVGVGKLVESFVVLPEKLTKMGLAGDALPTGVWMGFHVTDDEVWKRVKSGEYSMFSIGGTGERHEMAEAA